MDTSITRTTHIEIYTTDSPKAPRPLPPKRTKYVIFDIIGTLLSYDIFYTAVNSRIGSRLKAKGIHPLGFANAWMESADRENTFLQISGRHVPFPKVFQPLFYRTLMFQGISKPRDLFTDKDAAVLVDAYKRLRAREGVKECFEILRRGGFEVWALTSGDRERVKGYIIDNKIELDLEKVIFCEGLGVRKPHPIVYQHCLQKLMGKGKGDGDVWFAAAHMWDSAAAKRNGFKAAWCSVWEKEPVPEVFGQVDVIGESLVDMARKIVAAQS